MRSNIRAIALALAFPLSATVALLAQTVGDKVYSQGQAKQGLAVYDRECATCHDGGTMGPELWGDAFLAQWNGQSAAAFFAKIKDSMPENNPGSLTDDDVLRLVAFVLQQNGFPAGEKDLERSGALADMKFVAAP